MVGDGWLGKKKPPLADWNIQINADPMRFTLESARRRHPPDAPATVKGWGESLNLLVSQRSPPHPCKTMTISHWWFRILSVTSFRGWGCDKRREIFNGICRNLHEYFPKWMDFIAENILTIYFKKSIAFWIKSN